MSGCFIYPLAFTCVPALAWGVPVDSVAWMVDYIKHFAIDRTLIPADIDLFWFMDKTLFQNWLDLYFGYMETLLLFFFLAAGGIIYLISIKKHQPNRIYQDELILILSYLGGVIFWFLTAPDIRFGSGYLWGTTLLITVLWSLLSITASKYTHQKSDEFLFIRLNLWVTNNFTCSEKQ